GGGGGAGGGAGMGCEATLHSRAAASYFRPMGFWRRLFGGSGADDINPQRLDYLNEALALERQGDYDAALTSYRLALRDHPPDATSPPPDPPKPPRRRRPDPPAPPPPVAGEGEGGELGRRRLGARGGAGLR